VECSVDLTLGEMSYERQSAWLITAYDITQRNQSERERKELLRRLVRVQEEERKRISMELHDQMGQSLTALILGLKSLQDFLPEEPYSGEMLNHLHSIADGLGQEVHRLAVELRPASLDDLGLNTTLQNYAEEWSSRSQIEVDYQPTGVQDERLPSQIETAIYRIVQEALTNVARHSGATQASIHLDCRESQVFVIVEDNGCGFDPERVISLNGAYRLGLLGMKERAELAGGTCHIESSPGNGTTIYVRIPVKNDREEFRE
jgi:signal transduction histidine kinase